MIGSLEKADKSKIAEFFEPFGEIISIDLPKDMQDRNKGHAIIEFTTHKDAKNEPPKIECGEAATEGTEV